MRVLPSSGREWFAVFLIPFKVFLPAGYLMVVMERQSLGHRMAIGDLTSLVINGYCLSFLALVFGGTIQHRIGPRGAYISTCAFAASVFVFGLLLLPYLART